MLFSKRRFLDPMVDGQIARIDEDRPHFEEVMYFRYWEPEIAAYTFLYETCKWHSSILCHCTCPLLTACLCDHACDPQTRRSSGESNYQLRFI